MSHTIPLEPDCYYHIFNRGNNHEKLFVEERNYFHFMSLYGKYFQPVASTYAYCLLVDHFHFLIRIRTLEERMEYVRTQRQTIKYNEGMLLEETGSLDPSNQFSKLFNAYAKSFNATYKRTGACSKVDLSESLLQPIHKLSISLPTFTETRKSMDWLAISVNGIIRLI